MRVAAGHRGRARACVSRLFHPAPPGQPQDERRRPPVHSEPRRDVGKGGCGGGLLMGHQNCFLGSNFDFNNTQFVIVDAKFDSFVAKFDFFCENSTFHRNVDFFIEKFDFFSSKFIFFSVKFDFFQ